MLPMQNNMASISQCPSVETKIKAFLQECLVYIDMNKQVYMTDKSKIGLVLLFINEKEAKDWRELYLEDIKDPATEKLVYPTFGAFLTEVCKAFQSADHVQDTMYKLENLKQGKKSAEQVVTPQCPSIVPIQRCPIVCPCVM